MFQHRLQLLSESTVVSQSQAFCFVRYGASRPWQCMGHLEPTVRRPSGNIVLQIHAPAAGVQLHI